MLELRTLGAIGLTGDRNDGRLTEILSQPKRLALLAYLAVEGGGYARHRRETILGVFWRGMADSNARAALRRALYYLRQRLGAGVLEGSGSEELGLDRDRFRCDAAEVQRLLERCRHEEALALYRGDFLPGIGANGERGISEWLHRTRAGLRRSAAEAARSLATRAGERPERGWPAGRACARLLRRALEIDPADERTLRRLLRHLASRGDRAAAVAAYDEWQDRHQPELAPSGETEGLVRQIRSGADVQAAPVEAADGPAPAAEPDNVRSPSASALTSPRRIAARALVERARSVIQRDATGNAVARELAETAIELDPESAVARATLAEVLSRGVQQFGTPRSWLAAAREQVHRALVTAPREPLAHFAQGLLLETKGCIRRAHAALRRADAMGHGDGEFAGHLGRILLYAGRADRSLRWTRRAARDRPPSPTMLVQLAELDFALGRSDAAEELLREAGEIGEGLDWVEGAWTWWKICDGALDEARTIAERMLRRSPDGFFAHFARGEVALAARDFTSAGRHFERCQAIDDDGRTPGTLISVRRNLGVALSRLGDVERATALLTQAERDVRRILDRGADFCGFHYERASALSELGRTREALEALESAVEAGWIQPEFPRRDPALDKLRGELSFNRLLGRIERTVSEQRQVAS